MQALMEQCMNISECQDLSWTPSLAPFDANVPISLPESELGLALGSKIWALKLATISVIPVVWLLTRFQTRWASKPLSPLPECRDPPQMPYFLPLLGNMLSYLWNPSQLAFSIRQKFGASSVVRLNFLSKDVYVINGAEYLNAVWKNDRSLTSALGIRMSLVHMFATSKEDMKFYGADDSGIAHDPHPKSSIKPNNRVFRAVFKSIVDTLSGPQLTTAAQRFRDALVSQTEASPITGEWVEMDDLFAFVQPLIARSTFQTMCGASFLQKFPEYYDDFWYFNWYMPKFLHRFPRWIIPKAWQARDRCFATMKKWRKECQDGATSEAGAMIQERWKYFSKMEGLSEDGVARSDVGILWGMNSNSMPASFWLTWHMLRDRSLLARATREVDACRTSPMSPSMDFDPMELTQQPLLQSCFAETLRKYAEVFMIRQPEHEDARILDYRVPQGKMMVLNSAIAHMDQRNWNTGANEEHPVDTFWADRFLTFGSKAGSSSSDEGEPHFSLRGYSGSWLPFGGGLHFCPGRHWVKAQMLLSFAVINAAFEIELLHPEERLNVDRAKYGLGILQPVEKVRFRIRRRKTTM